MLEPAARWPAWAQFGSLVPIVWGALAFGAVYPWAYWPLAATCFLAMDHDGFDKPLSLAVATDAVFRPDGVILAERMAVQTLGAGLRQHGRMHGQRQSAVAAHAQAGIRNIEPLFLAIGDCVARGALKARGLDVDDMAQALANRFEARSHIQPWTRWLAGLIQAP